VIKAESTMNIQNEKTSPREWTKAEAALIQSVSERFASY